MLITRHTVEFKRNGDMDDKTLDLVGDFINDELEANAEYLVRQVLERFGVKLQSEVKE